MVSSAGASLRGMNNCWFSEIIVTELGVCCWYVCRGTVRFGNGAPAEVPDRGLSDDAGGTDSFGVVGACLCSEADIALACGFRSGN